MRLLLDTHIWLWALAEPHKLSREVRRNIGNDFGDRFIAATASVHNLTLITSDPQLLACSWLKTLANH